MFTCVCVGGVHHWLYSREITFYGDASNKISDHITRDIPLQMNILNTVIP